MYKKKYAYGPTQIFTTVGLGPSRTKVGQSDSARPTRTVVLLNLRFSRAISGFEVEVQCYNLTKTRNTWCVFVQNGYLLIRTATSV